MSLLELIELLQILVLALQLLIQREYFLDLLVQLAVEFIDVSFQRTDGRLVLVLADVLLDQSLLLFELVLEVLDLLSHLRNLGCDLFWALLNDLIHLSVCSNLFGFDSKIQSDLGLVVVLAVLVDRADHSDLRVFLQRLLKNSCQLRVSVINVALELLAQFGKHIA